MFIITTNRYTVHGMNFNDTGDRNREMTSMGMPQQRATPVNADAMTPRFRGVHRERRTIDTNDVRRAGGSAK